MASPRPLPSGPMGGSGSRIVWTDQKMFERAGELPQKINLAVAALMQYQAAKVQDHMRVNAPWTDRTGNARNGLFARYSGGGASVMGNTVGGAMGNAIVGQSEHAIDIYHTVPYGIWLEVRWSGKYAIIVPTLQTEGPRVMAAINGLMGRLS